MRDVATSLLQSRAMRALVSNLERKLPHLRAWHRFEYQLHFSEESDQARMFSGVYPSIAAAQDAAPKGSRLGYDHTETADRHAAETDQTWPSDYPILFWLARLLQQTAAIFDLGGATGRLFYCVQRYITYPKALRWTVCEVPAVAARGKDIAAVRLAGPISFTTRIDEAEDHSILVASSSLQFIDPPLWNTLDRLRKRPRHLLINRTPLSDSGSFVTLNNLGPSVCAYRIWDRKQFIQSFEALGYSLVDKWDTPEFSCYIPFHPERWIRAYSGMYFRFAGGSR